MRSVLFRALALAALCLPSPAQAVGTWQPPAPPAAPPIVTVSVPATAATTVLVEATVTVANPPATGYHLVLDYGEGRSADTGDYRTPDDDCTTLPGDNTTWRLRHAYRMAGVWQLRAILTLGCGLDDADPVFVGTTQIVVTPGASPSNGPFRPLARLVAVPPADHRTPPGGPPGRRMSAASTTEKTFFIPRDETSRGVFHLHAGDYDGFLARYTIRWGDGSRDTVVSFPTSSCQEPVTKQHWPESGEHTEVRHAFKAGKKWVTKLTVTITGCDGKDPQTASYTLRHRSV